jgi:hypothetical protein
MELRSIEKQRMKGMAESSSEKIVRVASGAVVEKTGSDLAKSVWCPSAALPMAVLLALMSD